MLLARLARVLPRSAVCSAHKLNRLSSTRLLHFARFSGLSSMSESSRWTSGSRRSWAGWLGAAGVGLSTASLCAFGLEEAKAETNGVSSATADAVAKVLPSVVAVTTVDQIDQAAATAFSIDTRGHVLTNYHVVRAALHASVLDLSKDPYRIVTSDGRIHRARFLFGDELVDLAVLKVLDEDASLPPLSFEVKSKRQLGELAVAVGSGIGMRNTATSGVLSGLSRSLALHKGIGSMPAAVQHLTVDATLNPGNSGGPVVNARGEVIGVAMAKLGGMGVENFGIIIPGETVKSVLEQLTDDVRIHFAGDPDEGSLNSVAEAYQASLKDIPDATVDRALADQLREKSRRRLERASSRQQLIAEHQRQVTWQRESKKRSSTRFNSHHPLPKKVRADREGRRLNVFFPSAGFSYTPLGRVRALADANGVELEQRFPDSLSDSALLVQKVSRDSAAERAGLLEGDIIVRVNGHNVSSESLSDSIAIGVDKAVLLVQRVLLDGKWAARKAIVTFTSDHQ